MATSLIMKAHAAIASARGWRRTLMAVTLGAAAALALPPVFAVPFLWPSFMGFFWLIASAETPRRAALDGWGFGFGYFFAGLWWISISLMVDADRFAWMLPFPLLGLPAILGFYIAIVALLQYAAGKMGVRSAGLLALLWMGVEYLRGHWLGQFPWNPVGLAWNVSDITMQTASLWGVYGVSGITVLLAAWPAMWVYGKPKRTSVPIFAVLMIAFVAFGAIRLSGAHNEYVENVRLRLVQPSIPQALKWDPRQQVRHLEQYLQLTNARGAQKVTHIIWPETAFPFPLAENSDWLKFLSQRLPQQAILLTGAVRTKGESDTYQAWNSLVVIGADGTLQGVYDKSRLVPFGEFVPMRSYLPVEKITPGTIDFSRGPGPVTLGLPGAPGVSPQVCYEAIFPELAVNPVHRPGWMLNVTNDGWFGNSFGPYQHFHMARLRAVEQGIPMVRSANNGISAVIDGYGRVVGSMVLNAKGAMDITLPKPVGVIPFYGKWGNGGLILLISLIVLFTFYYRK